jgi:hypothetical protein
MHSNITMLEDDIAKKLLRLSMYLNASSVVGNVISHLYYAAIVTLFCTILFFILSKLVENNRFEKILTKTNIVLIYYAYFSSIWFCNGGSSVSTIILFVILFFVTFVIVLYSKHIYFVVGAILLIILLYSTEYFFPQTIIQQYPTKFDKFLDNSIISIVALFLMKTIIEIIRESYLNEQKMCIQIILNTSAPSLQHEKQMVW